VKRTEEEKIAAGQLFCPGDPALREKKKKAHHLNGEYNRTEEEEVEKRQAILSDLLGKMGENCFLQGPIFFHYGCHTRIGDRFFANFHLTIQDDAEVSIGNDCNFGPNVTIVTPIHPMLPQERKLMQDAEGKPVRLCYAKPVKIGNDCWLCANVTVCSGVTIGDGCVIGAGSVVTRDIPAGYFAAGNPARIIRKLTEADSMVHLPQILADNQVIASFSQEAGENGSDR
jgi:maltose O-acetyltransferase